MKYLLIQQRRLQINEMIFCIIIFQNNQYYYILNGFSGWQLGWLQ